MAPSAGVWYNAPMKCFAVACMVWLLATALMAAQSPVIERLGFDKLTAGDAANAWINWERQVIKAVGVGVLPGDAANPREAEKLARQAAGINAYRNMESAIKLVRVHDDTLVGNVTPEVPEIRLKQLAHGSNVVSDRQRYDRSFEVILELWLAKIAAVLPPPDKPNMSDWEEMHPVPYFIDARGLELLPALQPKILNKAGKQVYSGLLHYSTDGYAEVNALEVRDLTDIVVDPGGGTPGATIILSPARESGKPSSGPSPN